jgi:hypothetical protein
VEDANLMPLQTYEEALDILQKLDDTVYTTGFGLTKTVR